MAIAVALLITLLIVALIVLAARPLARLFTRETGTMVVTVKPRRSSQHSSKAQGES